MKVTDIKIGFISIPLKTPFKTALRTVNSVDDVVIKISNREILQNILEFHNITSEKHILQIFNIIDKIHKLDKKVVIEMLLEEQLSLELINTLLKIIVLNEELRSLIQKSYDSKAIKKRALEMNMLSLRQDGIQKLLNGVTTIEEVLRVTQQ